MQEKYSNGENVSGRISIATREMNKNLDRAKDQLSNLESLAKQFPGIPKLGEAVEDIRNAIKGYKDVTENLRNIRFNDKNSGFENAIKGYETLSNRAERYYKILLKQQEGLRLSANESAFLDRNSEYFEAATRGAEEFKNSLNDVVSNLEAVKNKEKEFGNSVANAMESAVNAELVNLNNLMEDLGNKTGNA